MKTALQAFEQELDAIREAGTWREERIIITRNGVQTVVCGVQIGHGGKQA